MKAGGCDDLAEAEQANAPGTPRIRGSPHDANMQLERVVGLAFGWNARERTLSASIDVKALRAAGDIARLRVVGSQHPGPAGSRPSFTPCRSVLAYEMTGIRDPRGIGRGPFGTAVN